MSSEYMTSNEPRRSADLAGAPDAAGPHGKPPPGASASKRPRSRYSLILAGVAAGALLGGAGVAVAGTSSGASANAAAATAFTTSSRSASQPGDGHSGGMHGWGSGPGGGISVVHGQIVVAKAGGGYQTVDFQSGSVTAVSASSISVKSTDGFTQSYAITGSTNVDAQRDGIGSVKVGNNALVIATVSGRTATAVKVMDRTLLQQSHQQFGFGAGASGWSHGHSS